MIKNTIKKEYRVSSTLKQEILKNVSEWYNDVLKQVTKRYPELKQYLPLTLSQQKKIKIISKVKIENVDKSYEGQYSVKVMPRTNKVIDGYIILNTFRTFSLDFIKDTFYHEVCHQFEQLLIDLSYERNDIDDYLKSEFGNDFDSEDWIKITDNGYTITKKQSTNEHTKLWQYLSLQVNEYFKQDIVTTYSDESNYELNEDDIAKNFKSKIIITILPDFNNLNDLNKFKVYLFKSSRQFINNFANNILFNMLPKKITNFNFYLRVLTNVESYYMVQIFDTSSNYYYSFEQFKNSIDLIKDTMKKNKDLFSNKNKIISNKLLQFLPILFDLKNYNKYIFTHNYDTMEETIKLISKCNQCNKNFEDEEINKILQKLSKKEKIKLESIKLNKKGRFIMSKKYLENNDISNDNDLFHDADFKPVKFNRDLIEELLDEIDIPYDDIEYREMDLHNMTVKNLLMNYLTVLVKHDDRDLDIDADINDGIECWELLSDEDDNLYFYKFMKNKYTIWNEELYLLKLI